jgi:hypothetical protein
MRSHFRPASVILAIVSAIVLAAPVAATSPWTTFKQSGTNAFAGSTECTDNGDGTVTCEGESLDVFEGTMKASGEPNRTGEQACYTEFSDTFDQNTGEPIESHVVFGCALDAGTLTVDDLTSIALAPTVIELTAVDCDASDCTESEGGATTVDGTWTGEGPIFTQKSKFRFDDGTCMQVSADKSRSREASFEGSIDDPQFAMMAEGTFTFRTSCGF